MKIADGGDDDIGQTWMMSFPQSQRLETPGLHRRLFIERKHAVPEINHHPGQPIGQVRDTNGRALPRILSDAALKSPSP